MFCRIRIGLFLFLIPLSLAALAIAASSDLKPIDPAGGPPPREMLRDFLHTIASKQLAAREDQLIAVKTRQQIEQRKREIREKLLKMIGGLPTERTPLNRVHTGVMEHEDYRVEKIVYESLPKFYVTANLYIPKTGSPPYPAILHPLGHSQTGKAREIYQTLSIGLVKHGFVVLTYDPIGQGERTIFYDERIGGSLVGGSTREHQMVGVQSLLAGESVARYRVWDGIRGIDLLASLPEVDPKRIGITGCSGGGTATAYIAAIDDRLQAAADACYITAWEEQLLGTGPQDAEQQFPGQLREGVGHADFITAFAPKPYLISSTEDDFFPLEGARRAYNESKRLYDMLGVEEKIGWVVGPGGHGMRVKNREAIYGWMARWLKGGEAGPAAEPPITVEYDEDLNVTRTGQVATSLGGETASSVNIARFAEIQPARPRSLTRASLAAWVEQVKQKAIELTRYAKSEAPLRARAFNAAEREGYRIEQLLYDAEPGRYVPAILAIPAAARAQGQAVLFIDERGSSAAFAEGGDAAALARLGYTVLSIDLSGTAATRPDWGSYSDDWFGSDKTTWLALMVGRPLVGLHMAEIAKGIDLLAARGFLANGGAMVYAHGLVGVAALHAAAIDPRISALFLEESLISYRAIAETPIHRRIFPAVVPGVLGEYDLPDLALAVAPRTIALVNTHTPLGVVALRQDVSKAYAVTSDAYRLSNSQGAFRVGSRRETEALADAFPELGLAGQSAAAK